MAYFMANVPDLRLSDVDELLRETAMDDSNGQKILEYLRRKRGGARARLYDGSDNSFHFRLDHVQPVTVPQAGNSNRRELSTARSPEAAAATAAAAPAAAPTSPPASSSGALIQPLADLSVENRVSSFITPARLSVALSPVRTGAENARSTNVTSPTRKSTVHQYKRSNDMKFEALRHASHLASSTPIAGEHANRKGQNLLNFRETISPILDEQVPGTPTHRPARNSYRGEQGAQVGPATIQTPVPATQDVPDGTEQQNGRENTPPREQNASVVIPETPSPGRSNAFDDDGGGSKDPASPSRSTENVARSPTRPPSAGDHPARPDRQLPRSSAKACNNRTNRNTINMIMDDWDERATSPMEVDQEQGEAGEGETANRTITETLAITNVVTPRTVVMDILEPPSAFCDDDTANDSDSRLPTDQEEPNNQASPGSSDSDSSRKRKQENLRVLITAVPSPKQSKLSLPQPVGNTTLPVPQHSERLVSVNSPHDHVPLDMIQTVDMIHSKVNSELLEPKPGGDAGMERRITICNPPKRRATKSKVDADTEIYFQTVENTCSQEGPKAKQRKERRKLFVQEPADRMPEDEERQPIPSPVPLPLTQELVDSQEQRVQSKQKQQSVKELAVLVKRLSDVTITRCIQSPDRSVPKVAATARSSPVALEMDEEYDSPVELAVREKQNEERSEKSDRTKEEKRKEEKCSPPQQVERAASPKRKLKPSGPSKRKKKEKPPAGASSPEPAATKPNDDATNTAEANERSEVSNPSKQSSSKADRTASAAAPPNTTAASSSSSSPSASFSGADMLAEKRKAMDWMMVLMENRQNRAAGLPNVELQGFTHLSLEHLAFQRCKGIEYSFYVYSNKDNFGFLRVLPNVTKKTTFTKHCSLKFLILSGALKFIINGYEVNVVGGDFLMIPPTSPTRVVHSIHPL
uniref:Mif2/CENP-C cupin domain-containing protein n=1 Tax=Anopheles coluzzii TaxID=1518534 RepID=A0A8W7PS08_ANOCL